MIQSIIDKFKNNQSALWIENGILKASVSESIRDAALKTELGALKTQLIAFLTLNHIDSEEAFLNTKIFKFPELESYPLSFAQERLWFIEQFEEGTNAYHVPMFVGLKPDTDVNRLKVAIQAVIQRHEVLRTVFKEVDGEYTQIALDKELEVNVYNYLAVDIDKQIQKDINTPFDLENDFPLRVSFYEQKNEVSLLVNIHHIASDGWSTDILLREIALFYDQKQPEELTVQYKDFSVWQRQYLRDEVLTSQLDYWKGKLNGYEALNLPLDGTRPKHVDYKGDGFSFSIKKSTSQQLRDLSKEQGCTMYSTLLSGFYILLSKYTSQEDIVLGTPIANRHYSEIQGLIGFFVNSLVLREQLNTQDTSRDLLTRVHQSLVEAQVHQDTPFEKIVEALEIPHDTSRHPIFQVMFSVQSFGGDAENKLFTAASGNNPFVVAKHDLSCFIDDSQEEICGAFNYATSLFDKPTIERMANHYVQVLEQMVEEKTKKLADYHLLNTEEHQRIINDWNKTSVEFPSYNGIHRLFEKQVQETPEAIALTFEGEKLTYTELNYKANQIANHLRSTKEISSDTLIAICMTRSTEMIIGILGILKSGAAYVPIDSELPNERIQYLLNDTQAKIVLTQTSLVEKLSVITKTDLLVLNSEEHTHQPTENLDVKTHDSDLAYVIYTSGTTGNPKGVMVEHQSVNNYIHNLLGYFEAIDRVDFSSNLSFDLSVTTTLAPLCMGKTICIYGGQLIDIDQYVNHLNEQKIDFIKSTPSFLTQVPFEKISQKPNSCFIGGEKCTSEQLKSLNKVFSNVYDEYGPTETTVGATIILNTDGINSIGRAYNNYTLYVLDKNLNSLQIGGIGELHIGGNGLSRGYLNQPELTSEKFIPNPFSDSNERLYKTGDLVKWLPNGNIQYIGRNDFQVKIRGYRIELSEIENALTSIEKINSSCVLAKERNGTKYLAAYYTTEENVQVSEEEVSQAIEHLIPNYMVPESFVQMDAFPLNLNGKLDRKAFPEKHFTAVTESYIAPEGELENKISEIYASVLGLRRTEISTHSSFFKMGGNSILSLKLKRQLNDISAFAALTVADIFKYDSVQKLVQSVNAENTTNYNEQNLNNNYKHEIAIISTSAAFSGSTDVTEFWRLLINQEEGVEFYTKEACQKLGINEYLINKPSFVPVSGKVKDIDLFDPAFWSISPNEAKLLDPQIRKFIEHCWYALESAGYSKTRREQTIGVFSGSGANSYFEENILSSDQDNINVWEVSGANSKDALSTKTAYFLGLTGPANSINTACSTSLVTVAEACKNLQIGSCNMALAGGVSLLMPNQVGYIYQDDMILSKDGHCRTFDKDATGVTGGSGVGVVLLKRLEDAEADGDTILGVIKGYATNNDGDRKTSYTAPSVIGQSECIINAQKMAGIQPSDIDYIECHGTATNLGDPIEIQALKEAFEYTSDSTANPNHTCFLGAVKANIGHADSAAGVAGLIKVCAMLQNEVIPGQVNFNEPNPELHLDKTSFTIPTINQPWLKREGRSRTAGVSAFGIGGTNAHIIVSEYQVLAESTVKSTPENNNERYLFPLSAKNRRSLEKYKTCLIKYLSKEETNDESLANIAYTLTDKRVPFESRVAYSAASSEELVAKLKTAVNPVKVLEDGVNPIVFMFPGYGAQYANMAKSIYDNEPDYRAIVDHCIEIANTHLTIDLHQVIYPSVNSQNAEESINNNVHDIQWAQISTFIISYSLAKYLEDLGIEASAYIGHSTGEYVAATIAGVFEIEDTIKLVIARGKLMQQMPSGSMLSVQSSEARIAELVDAHRCEISLINSPDDLVISGDDKNIAELKTQLDALDIKTVTLESSHGYHSRTMQAAADAFIKEFEELTLKQPKKNILISNLTGTWATEEVTTPEYWGKHLRYRVEFNRGVQTLSDHFKERTTFIEVGVGKSLNTFVKKHIEAKSILNSRTVQLVPSFKESTDTDSPLLQFKEDIFALCWANNIPYTHIKASQKHQQNVLDLPCYQFDHKSYWIQKSKKKQFAGQRFDFLPKEQWMSAPTWTSICNVKTTDSKISSFQKALFVVSANQEQSIDFNKYAEDPYLLVLDETITEIDLSERNRIRINPTSETGHKKLTRFLCSSGKPDSIIHLATSDQTTQRKDPLEYGFYHLFMLKRYLLPEIELNHFLILSAGLAQISNIDSISAFNGAMVGAIRNINHEHISTNGIILDIGNEWDQGLSSLSYLLEQDEFYKSESVLALKNSKLWSEELRTIKNIKEDVIIEDGDTIVITGGLGGVGLAMAHHISEKHRVNLVLISRRNLYTQTTLSKYDKEKLATLDKIKTNGCSVVIENGDISNQPFIDQLVSSIEKQYGAITGIIHTAGVVPIPPGEHTLSDIKGAFNGKVYGIQNIINATNLKKLKFLASTSSNASLLGDVNKFEYCASNSYLDYLCVDKLQFQQTRVVSINWFGWTDIGMVRAADSNEELLNTEMTELYQMMMDNGVKAKEGTELFYNLINQDGYEQVSLSKININLLREELFPKKQITPIEENVDITIIEDECSDLEYRIAQLYCGTLGLEEISLTDDFFRLGGNSISAIMVVHKLNKELSENSVKYSVTDLYKLRTIKALAKITTDQSFSIVKPLSVQKENTKQLFFIHPGNAGCEVYAELASKLKDTYNSYGVDNYNILNEEKIDSLQLLAKIYAHSILLTANSQEINLCGWSLGGKLSLEIAHILEQKGYSTIHVYLLDSLIRDKHLLQLTNEEDEIEIMSKMETSLLSIGYEEAYVKKVMQASIAEMSVNKQPLSGVLETSNVVLFKALLEDKRIDFEKRNEMHEYTLSIHDNHIGQFVKHLEVVHLQCNHGNILEYFIANDTYSDLLLGKPQLMTMEE